MEHASRRRPKDRKQQILEHAARLFVERGFHTVRLEEIAEQAGVTARALYRHYANKQALLAAVILTSQETYQAVRHPDGATPAGAPRPLAADLHHLVDAALATRQLTVLWQREARYLDDADRRQVRSRINIIVNDIANGVSTEIPTLTARHAQLRAWAVSSTLTSLGFHDRTLPGDRLPALLRRACAAAAHTHPVADLTPHSGPPAPVSVLHSRRESLLAAGAHLFRARGYPGVSTGDIGREAGIAGSGIYRTFASKQAILDELVRRLDLWRTLECQRALRDQPEPTQVLARLLDGYARISLDDPDLVAVTVTELAHASPDVLDAVSRSRADRETEWIEHVAGTSPVEARLLLAAATTFIDDVARTRRLADDHGVREEIVSIAHTILCSSSRG